MDPLAPAFHHAPLEIAPDTFLIQQLHGEGTPAPVNVYLNSMVIRGKEPVVVDTGTHANRKQWFEDVLSLVDPKDVKWIFLSHDDHDHTGNLRQALELFENATLVTNWFTVERLVGDIEIPLSRMRWVNDGEMFDAGDRTFAAIRPPVFDAPTTRGLYDLKTGVYWGSDCFGTPVLGPTENVADLDPEFWAQGVYQFGSLVSPWHTMVDQKKWDRSIDRIARMGVNVIASGHGPITTGQNIYKSLAILRELPSRELAPVPGQADLEAMVAAMMTPDPEEVRRAA